MFYNDKCGGCCDVSLHGYCLCIVPVSLDARQWTACANGHVATDYNIRTTAPPTRHRNGRSPPDRLHARAGSAREYAIVAVSVLGRRDASDGAGAAVLQHAHDRLRVRRKTTMYLYRCTSVRTIIRIMWYEVHQHMTL